MTDTEKLFTDLLRSLITEAKVSPRDFDITELLGLSQKHKVVPLIFGAMQKSGIGSEVEGYALFKNAARIEATAGIRKEIFFLKFYEDLKKKNISPIVVKGATLKKLYPLANSRFSTDEDLLFTYEELLSAEDVFKENGLVKNEVSEEDTVWGYRNPANGLYIEAHTSLFPHYPEHNKTMNEMFENAEKNSVFEDINGTQVRTLCPTEHLLFLILHSFKHFIYCGFGIRQVTDFILFAKSHRDTADSEFILENLANVNAIGFFDALLCICNKYFDTTASDLGFGKYTPKEYDVSDLMADILSGGAYGNSTKERLHSSKMTLSATEKKGKVSPLTSLFPPLGSLKTEYSYLAKHPWLLPAAWASRIIKHLRKDKSERSFDHGETLQIGKERINMMKKYGIIK